MKLSKKQKINQLRKELQLKQNVLFGYQSLDELNDHLINYYNTEMSQYSEATLNQLIEGKPQIKELIYTYSRHIQHTANQITALGADPFPMTTEDYMRIENELMAKLPSLTRTRRARIFTWFRNLLKRKAAQ